MIPLPANVKLVIGLILVAGIAALQALSKVEPAWYMGWRCTVGAHDAGALLHRSQHGGGQGRNPMPPRPAPRLPPPSRWALLLMIWHAQLRGSSAHRAPDRQTAGRTSSRTPPRARASRRSSPTRAPSAAPMPRRSSRCSWARRTPGCSAVPRTPRPGSCSWRPRRRRETLAPGDLRARAAGVPSRTDPSPQPAGRQRRITHASTPATADRRLRRRGGLPHRPGARMRLGAGRGLLRLGCKDARRCASSADPDRARHLPSRKYPPTTSARMSTSTPSALQRRAQAPLHGRALFVMQPPALVALRVRRATRREAAAPPRRATVPALLLGPRPGRRAG